MKVKRNTTGKEPKVVDSIERIEQSEQLPMGVQKKENKSTYGKILEVKRYPYTPFNKVVMTEDETDCFIAVGNKRVTEIITGEIADKKVKYKDWDLLQSLMTIIAEGVVIELMKDYQLKPIENDIQMLKEKFDKK